MKKRTVALTMAASMMASSLGIGGVTAYAAEDPIVIGAVSVSYTHLEIP